MEENRKNQNINHEELAGKVENVYYPRSPLSRGRLFFIATVIVLSVVLCLGILYQAYTNRTYVVNFDSVGGSAVEAIKVTVNLTAAKPADPVKAGYKFTGWVLEDGTPSPRL